MSTGTYKLPDWWRKPDAVMVERLETELQRELPQGHLLYRIPVEAFGYSEGSDDVLFRQRDKPDRFTVVHLSWLGRTEINSLHPTVEFDGTFAEFLKYHEEMLAFFRNVAKKQKA